jgi:hypothetical protein
MVRSETDLGKLVLDTVMRETGLTAHMVKRGEQFHVTDEYGEWLMSPFLLTVEAGEVVLDRSHVEFEWIRPGDVDEYEGVKDLESNLSAVGLVY